MSLVPLTFPRKILAAPLSAAGTRLIMPDIEHWDGNDLTSGEVGTLIYATLQNFARTKMEIVELDPSTLTVATTTGILINKRACGYMGGTSASAETAYDWVANETYVQLGSNPPQLYTNLVDLDEAQTIAGVKTFSSVPKTTGGDATVDNDLVRKAQLDAAVLGSLTVSPVVLPGTAGETILVDQLVYLKVSDGRWWLIDADTAATVDNIVLGISRGGGTAGVAITSGVTVLGEHVAASAIFTANTKYFASNTAGGFATSAGTNEVTVGYARSTTQFLLYPRYDQMITEDQQDALAGSSGTPSGSNKFVTANDTTVWDGSKVYAASVVGTDAYAATITGATLANGLTLRIKLDVANTGPATFNLNAGGALALVTGLSTPLVTGDYVANQIIEIVYNSTGTVWQVVTPPAPRGYSIGRAVAAESLTADRYVTFSSSAAMSATEPPGFIVPHAATIRKLYVRTGTISANGTCVVTVRKNGVDTALTLSTNDTNSNATVSDLTNSFTVVAGDRLTIKLAYSTNTSEFCSFSVEVLPS